MNKKNLFWAVLLSLLFLCSNIVYAAYERYSAGDTASIGEFVYEDDFTASTADCTITIYNPSGAAVVTDGTMTEAVSGWHSYDYAIPSSGPDGIWPTTMSCGTALAGDLVKMDKTFSVGNVIVSSSTIATAVWDNSNRTLSSFGSLAADVWNDTYAPTRRLTDSTLTGGGSLPTNSDLDTKLQNATSTIITEILANRTLISSLNNISANDVWNAGTRTLTDYATSSIASATASSTATEVWSRASSQLTSTGSIGKLLADNIDVTISSRGTSNLSASDVWAAGTRTLSDYATSSIASAAAISVWANADRTLTSYGNDITADEVWDVLTSSLVSVDSIGKLLVDDLDTTISTRASLANQIAGWTITMSDYSSVQAGSTYRTRIEILNSNSVPTTPFAIPTVTLYDAERNVTVSGVPMTAVGTGIYEYTYLVASGASQGVWETVISTQVESGKTLSNNDYWIVAGSPAQVIINSVSGDVPNASANITITNEGLAGYEYQYEWCVVSDSDNACGGGDDVYHATGAKFIDPNEDWNTNLTATIPSAGAYYFKLVVYFGTERSGSSRSFTIDEGEEEEEEESGGGGGGGSGGASGGSSNSCSGADFNGDNKVNSIDFSILLAFWKTKAPFANPCIDIDENNVVDSIDFSIMLSQWNTSGR